VKAARAVVASSPGLAATLTSDLVRAAWFYARFGITEGIFRHGAPGGEADSTSDQPETLRTPIADREEASARESAAF
jgi:hypothetical protein